MLSALLTIRLAVSDNNYFLAVSWLYCQPVILVLDSEEYIQLKMVA